jgi:hypothetical protein
MYLSRRSAVLVLQTDTLSLSLFCTCCRYVLSLFTIALNTNTLFQDCFSTTHSCLPAHDAPDYIHPRPLIDIFEKRNAFLDPNIHHGFRAGYLNSPQAPGHRLFPQTLDSAGVRPARPQDAARHN